MEISFTFRDFEATEGLKEHAEKKFEKIDKYLIKPVSAHFILSKDGTEHKAELNINDGGTHYLGTDKTNDMYLSIDNAINKLASQLKKHKEKVKDHHHKG